jgi:hypothetical protein
MYRVSDAAQTAGQPLEINLGAAGFRISATRQADR